MKVDPVTGKRYFTEWERDLARIRKAGYSCGYVQLKDLDTGRTFWQVDAQKRGGPRVVVQNANISEAVRDLTKLLLKV